MDILKPRVNIVQCCRSRPVAIVSPRGNSTLHAGRAKTCGWVVTAATGSEDGSSDESNRDYHNLRDMLSRRWMEEDVGSKKVSLEDAVQTRGRGPSSQEDGGDDLDVRTNRHTGDGTVNSGPSGAWSSLAAQTLTGLDSAIRQKQREGGGESSSDAGGSSSGDRDGSHRGSEGAAAATTAAGGRAWLAEMASTRRDGIGEREEPDLVLQPQADSSTIGEEGSGRSVGSGSCGSSSTDPPGREAPSLPSLELSRYASACTVLRAEARELGIPEAVLPAVPAAGSAECTVEGLAALRDLLVGMIDSRLSSNL